MPYKSIAQNDFSGGANYIVNPYLISQKQAADFQNLVLDEHGSVHSREGLRTLLTNINTADPIVFIGTFIGDTGTIGSYAVTKSTPGNQLYALEPAIGLAFTFTTSESIPWGIQAENKLVVLNGYETPLETDGITFIGRITAGAGQTVPPGAKHGAFHLGSLWLWNTNPTTTTLDGPSSLRMSDPNDLNSWPNSNQTFVAGGDGQVGMGMSSFTIVETGISPTATMVLFKNFSAYEISGVLTPPAGGTTVLPASIQQIKSDMGCIAPRTIQFVSGFGIIRLTHKGFALYNGVEDRLISEEIRPHIFAGVTGNDYATGLDFSNIIRSWAAQIPNPPIYIAACPENGAPLTKIFLYDLVRRAWSLATFPASISCLWLHLRPDKIPTVRAGAFVGGQVYEVFPINVFDDDGKDVAWKAKTRVYFHTNQMEPTYFRRALFNAVGIPLHQFRVTPIIDGVADKQQTFFFPDVGIGLPPSSDLVKLSETTFNMDIMRTAHTIQYIMEGEGRTTIRGLETHTIQKPLTRFQAIPTIGRVVQQQAPIIHTMLTLTKILSPPDDPGKFKIFLDGNLVLDNATHNSTVAIEVTPGAHVVTETAIAPTSLTDYITTFGGDLDSTGHITLASGDNSTGTIFNDTGGGRLIITGFEGGQAEAGVVDGSVVYHSLYFQAIGGFSTGAPPIKTDIVHSGTYSVQFGFPSNSTDGIQKHFDGTLSPPITLSARFYVYFVTFSTTAFDVLIFGTPTTSPFNVGAINGHAHLSTQVTGVHNSISSETLVTGQWYRVVYTATVDAGGTNWTTKVRYYLGEATTPVLTMTDSNSDYNSAPISTVRIGNYFDTDHGWDIRMDDLIVEQTATPFTGPFALALVTPNADVDVHWVRGGSSPAATNALNVGTIPRSNPVTDALRQNTIATFPVADRFSLNTSRIPTGKVLRNVSYLIRGATTNSAAMAPAQVDNANSALFGPIITAFESGSTTPRTDSVFQVDISNINLAVYSTYTFGYASVGNNNTDTRKIYDFWGMVEYGP